MAYKKPKKTKKKLTIQEKGGRATRDKYGLRHFSMLGQKSQAAQRGRKGDITVEKG